MISDAQDDMSTRYRKLRALGEKEITREIAAELGIALTVFHIDELRSSQRLTSARRSPELIAQLLNSLDDGNGKAQFGHADLSGVTFTGDAYFRGATFSEDADFSSVTFTGRRVTFTGAKFTGGTVDFGGAKFTGGTVNLGGATFTGGRVDYFAAEFTGGTVGEVAIEIVAELKVHKTSNRARTVPPPRLRPTTTPTSAVSP